MPANYIKNKKEIFIILSKTFHILDPHLFDLHLIDDEGWTSLHYSARYGSYKSIKFLVGMGTDINLKTNDGMNCLHIAADQGHLNLCKTLIKKHNFDLEKPDDYGWTALHYSANNGSYELVKFFGDMGTDVNLKTDVGQNCLHIAAERGHLNLCKIFVNKHKFNVKISDYDRCTALHYATRNGSYELIKFFTDSGTDINLKTKNGLNCLHIAADEGHLNLCNTFINKHKFDVQIPDNNGWTALHYSAGHGSYELVKFFADMGSDINLKTNDGRTCLHIAANRGYLNLCKTFVNEHKFNAKMPDNNGWTALHYSAGNDSYELFKLFADMGSDVNLKTNDGRNCLHIAAECGHLNLCKTLINKYNVNVQVADNDGYTALHFSASNGSCKLVKFFANMGIDINLKANHEWNCLHIAALNGHLNLCKTLLNKYKFHVQVADNDGWTALHFSARNGSYKLVNFFADMGIDINLKTNSEWNCLHIAALNGHLNLCKTLISKYKFDVQVADNDGWNVLHLSARNGSYKLVKFFADMGIDINLKTKDGRNCLHIAAHNGHLNLCQTLISKHNLDVQVPSNDGCTALHYSAINGCYELVKFFGDMGIDINLKENNGDNCLHIAAHYGHLNLCKAFINEHKFDVKTRNKYGFTALHFSAVNGSYELVNFFVDMGSDINLRTNDGKNCLHFAASFGHLILCKTLVNKHNFDVQLSNNNGYTALHYSSGNGSYRLVTFFADMVTDIDCKSKNGANCLHIAAFSGHLNLCKTFINKYNFDVQVPDDKGRTALHHSAENGSYKLVKFFTDMGSDINLKTNDGRNCLHIAADCGHLNLCKTLMNKYNVDVQVPDDDGWTALHFSARNGSYKLVSFFADMVSDIKLKTNDGRNCLHIAADCGHLNLCTTFINKHKFDVQIPNNDGWTALHYSAKNGSCELVKFFADMGADVNLKTKNGLNCLHIAAEFGHLSLCKMFIKKHNFDAQITDNNGWSALHYSVRNGSRELVNFFADNGTEINLKTKNGTNCLHIAAKHGHLHLCKTFINSNIFDVETPNNDEYTALHFSAINGSFDLFSYILNKGSEIYGKTKNMENVLHLSSLKGHFDICNFVLKYFMKDYEDQHTKKQYTLNCNSYRSQVFYKYKAIFLHAMDVDGNTYLHLATKGNQTEICQLLLRYDTDIITLLNKEDKTAWEIAKDNGRKDVLNALKIEFERAGMLFLIILN